MVEAMKMMGTESSMILKAECEPLPEVKGSTRSRVRMFTRVQPSMQVPQVARSCPIGK